MVFSLLLERWAEFNAICMRQGRGDRNLGSEEAFSNYSKGGEAG